MSKPIHVYSTMTEDEYKRTQSRVGHLKKTDSNTGPKDAGARPTTMPDQPHVGNLPHRESNAGRDSGGSVPGPITSHGPTKNRS